MPEADKPLTEAEAALNRQALELASHMVELWRAQRGLDQARETCEHAQRRVDAAKEALTLAQHAISDVAHDVVKGERP